MRMVMMAVMEMRRHAGDYSTRRRSDWSTEVCRVFFNDGNRNFEYVPELMNLTKIGRNPGGPDFNPARKKPPE
jgi:hypothetical protein